MKKKSRLLSLILFIVPTFLILWLSGFLTLWTEGISYVAENATDYNTKGHIVDGEYSISIDLSNLGSNLGKELYNDGDHTVYVSNVYSSGSVNSGGYIISFRTKGNYSLREASLVSGIKRILVNGNSYSSEIIVKMTAEYNGETYNSSVFGGSGLNYKDGDEFGFYIFPAYAYQVKDGVSLDEKGVVVLTVSNLYRNIWKK